MLEAYSRVLILESRILVQWSIVLTLTLQWKMRHWAPAWLNLRMPLKLSVLFGMLQLVVARMLFQHSVPPITMRMKEGVRIRWMLVCPTICPSVELDLLELRMDPIQILWNVLDRAMRSSMLRWRVIRRLTCWLTMLILTRMPCTTIQMGGLTPSFL
jgi:hypothetical protein